MITYKEIDKLAREYAFSRYPYGNSYDDEYLRRTVTAEMKEKLTWLLRSHCIVPKERIKEYYDDVLEDIADYKGEGMYGLSVADPTMCERAKGQKQMLHRLFGSQLGKESKK